MHGRHHGRPRALQSGVGAFRSRRASWAGDAIWPRRWGNNPVLEATGSLVAWLPRGCTRGPRTRAHERARDWPRCHADACAVRHGFDAYLVRELRGSKRAIRRSSSFGGREGQHHVEGLRNAEPRLGLLAYRKSLGRSSNNFLRTDRIAVNGINTMDTVVFSTFGASLCGTRPIR